MQELIFELFSEDFPGEIHKKIFKEVNGRLSKDNFLKQSLEELINEALEEILRNHYFFYF